MEGRFRPIIKSKPAITTGISFSLDANLIKKIKIHLGELLTNTVGIFRHSNWTCGAAKITTTYYVNPKFIRLCLFGLITKTLP